MVCLIGEHILCEKKGRFYVGITTNPEKRLKQHGNALLLYKEGPLERRKAVLRERQLKGWSRAKKLQIVKNSES